MASSDFKKSDFKKLVPPGATVREFEMPLLGQEKKTTYQSIKKTFKADPANHGRDSRFMLSDMVHNHLSVEAEEERRFNERLNQEVAKASESARTTAHKEGYEKGLEEGRALAFEKEKARVASLVEGLARVMNTIVEAKSRLAEDYEARLVALAFRMASVVVDHQVKAHPEAVSHSVRAILDKIGQDEDIRIRVSADDHAIVEQLDESFKTLGHKGRITLDLDASLKRGDCIVEAGSGEIASLIDEKIQGLRFELEKIYPNADLGEKTGT